MNWNQLSIDTTHLNCDRLLQDWRWLVPEDLRPFSLTIFGDWFFEDSIGQVIFLDVVGAELNRIARSRSEFLVLREQVENQDQWYMADLALLCLERGLQPKPGECLSFIVPPVLNGALEPDNIEVCDLMVHESLMGQIHRGVRDFPEGTVIDRFLIDGEEP